MDRFPTGHFSAGVAVQRPSGRRPYLVQVSALPRENEFSRQEKHASAIAFISDLDASPFLDQELLVRSFGLTKAEAALTQELLSGDGQERIAQRMGISENTVKTQLQSIYNKTDTHRQAQLVKFLLSIASRGA